MADSTTVSMPDTPKNQEAYPQSTSQKPGLGFPITRLVVLISLATGVVVDVAIGTYKGTQKRYKWLKLGELYRKRWHTEIDLKFIK